MLFNDNIDNPNHVKANTTTQPKPKGRKNSGSQLGNSEAPINYSAYGITKSHLLKYGQFMCHQSFSGIYMLTQSPRNTVQTRMASSSRVGIPDTTLADTSRETVCPQANFCSHACAFVARSG